MSQKKHYDRARGERPFAFQNLDVYKRMLEYLDLVHRECRHFPHDVKDNLDRAANSIVFNFGEGSGKKPRSADRKRYYRTSKASATESVGGWDIARVRELTDLAVCDQAEDMLSDIAAMLSRMLR